MLISLSFTPDREEDDDGKLGLGTGTSPAPGAASGRVEKRAIKSDTVGKRSHKCKLGVVDFYESCLGSP